jgi:triacylglycerol lipase
MNLVFASGFLVPQHILGINYFKGMEDRLQGKHDALFADVPALDTCEKRANLLADQIHKKFPDGEIHIIAHSMGGLDSRSLIARNLNGLSAPGRIASLTTLSTPHRGSPVADLLLGTAPSGVSPLVHSLVSHAVSLLSLPAGALGDLTAEGAARIPDAAATHPHIRYRSVFASGRPDPLRPTSLVLAPTHHYIHSVTGQANDGVVALDSARYGEFLQPFWACDHVDMVGHNLDFGEFSDFHFDHFAAIEALINTL